MKLLLPLLLLLSTITSAQDLWSTQRASWLQKAEASKPKLVESIAKPQRVVNLINDEDAFQDWKVEDAGISVDSLYNTGLLKTKSVVVDFGKHITGTFSFRVESKGVSDAPIRFKFTFGEVPSEVAVPFDPYPGGLSRAWLQDEIVTVNEVPASITIPRRVSFRYLKIEILATSPFFDFMIKDMQCKATTSVTTKAPSLAANTSKEVKDIYNVGLETLKECMQTVYEDGPKRDRRLWIGDLYLESIANVYSFKNHDLTKHCLYLLAALAREDGYLNSNVFETPEPHPQTGAPILFDYTLLYNVALKEYLTATNDKETALDLWPIALKQIDQPKKFLLPNGLFDYAAASQKYWLFVDWKEGLDRQAALQGIIVYSMKQTLELAKLLGKEKEVADLPAQIKKMTEGARKNLWDKSRSVIVSGPEKQLSIASQAWMTLAGILTKAEAQKALKYAMEDDLTIRQGAPYLYHYFIEALVQSGMNAEAKEALTSYWGDMVNKGADTFWEVYDPNDEYLSPYNFYPVNSYCHAWSCTPVYFILKYPGIFQN